MTMIPNHSASDDFFDHRVIRVDPGQHPLRIDKYLMERLEYITRNRVQNAIRAGAITVGEQPIKPNYKVRPGDAVHVILPKPPGEGREILPQNIPLDIRYEDNDVMVIHKPAGLVVHPGVGHSKYTLVNALAYYHQNLPVMDNNFPDRPGLVHRIDKETSGLLVVAKNEYAMNRMAKQFFYHTIERKYVAIIWGEPEHEFGTIKANIGRDPKNRKEMAVFEDEEQGKWAVTHWKALERLYYVSVVECQLETGRTHQIRVHMKHLGHPLFADGKYGGKEIVKGTRHRRYEAFVNNCLTILPRHALHAKSLGFEHPTTGEWLNFDSELPQDMVNCIEKWRHYVEHQKELIAKG